MFEQFWCNFDAIFPRNVIGLVLGVINLVFSTIWAGVFFFMQTWQPLLKLYFQSTFYIVSEKRFSHYFPWHPSTTSQPPVVICLWHSSSQTLDFYCNGKSWNISCFLLTFPLFHFSSSCLKHLPTSSQVLFLHSQWMY